jgi:energy-coupling factor transport system substrate-specific component
VTKMNSRQALLTAGGIALNLTLAKLAVLSSLPVYFDSVATIISVALLPWYLSVTIAVGTSLLGSMIIDPHLAAYCATQLTIALAAVLCFRAGLLNSWPEALLAGLLIALCAVIVSAPVTVLLFGGITWSETTVVTAILLESGKNLWQSVLQGAILIESIDKTSASLLAYVVLKHFPLQHTDNNAEQE